MGYNPFRWYTNGRRKKPLKKSEPLLLRIRNGNFEYLPYFDEAEKLKEEGAADWGDSLSVEDFDTVNCCV